MACIWHQTGPRVLSGETAGNVPREGWRIEVVLRFARAKIGEAIAARVKAILE